MFEKGVKHYTILWTKLKIQFKEDRICCAYCNRKYCIGNRTLCHLTGEEMLYPNKFIGNECPLHDFCEEVKP